MDRLRAPAFKNQYTLVYKVYCFYMIRFYKTKSLHSKGVFHLTVRCFNPYLNEVPHTLVGSIVVVVVVVVGIIVRLGNNIQPLN